jgi:hypothetical protein
LDKINKKLDITVISINYNNFFDTWGKQWIDTILQTNPQPVKVLLVTDKFYDIPKNFDQLVLEPNLPMVTYFNEGIKTIKTEWTAIHGLDDLFDIDAFEYFESDADCYSFPHKTAGMRTDTVIAQKEHYSEIFLKDFNPMWGGFFHKTKLLKEIPLRNYGYFDWIHFCEMAYFQKKVEFSDKSRTTWIRHPKAHSQVSNSLYGDEIHTFRNRLCQGLIKKGIPENDH